VDSLDGLLDSPLEAALVFQGNADHSRLEFPAALHMGLHGLLVGPRVGIERMRHQRSCSEDTLAVLQPCVHSKGVAAEAPIGGPHGNTRPLSPHFRVGSLRVDSGTCKPNVLCRASSACETVHVSQSSTLTYPQRCAAEKPVSIRLPLRDILVAPGARWGTLGWDSPRAAQMNHFDLALLFRSTPVKYEHLNEPRLRLIRPKGLLCRCGR
jgi:hypothetical protein